MCGSHGAVFLGVSYDHHRDVQPATQLYLWLAVAVTLWVSLECVLEVFDVIPVSDFQSRRDTIVINLFSGNTVMDMKG